MGKDKDPIRYAGYAMIIAFILMLALIFVQESKGEDKVQSRFYLTTINNSTATPWTIVVRIKNKKRNNIRLHQTINHGESSVPVMLRKGVEYEMYGYCNVCGQSVKFYFVNAYKPINIFGHNCTNFRWDKRQPRRKIAWKMELDLRQDALPVVDMHGHLS